jgi:hypothetical protein
MIPVPLSAPCLRLFGIVGWAVCMVFVSTGFAASNVDVKMLMSVEQISPPEDRSFPQPTRR